MKPEFASLLALAGRASSSAIGSQHVLGSSSLPHVNLDTAALFKCDLPPAIAPDGDGLPSADDLFSGYRALELQIKRHSAIVGVPTVSYDDMVDVENDPRWLPFLDLHALLKRLFPAVHARMDLVKVNRLALVYTIQGSNPSLKPLMLAAHQDVVPVADPSTWTYPPFSGHYDGKYLWGRGSSDDKNSLTAILSVMEALLSNETWTPRRTILLAFGFDEEVSGWLGAGHIASYLEELYGPDSMALILDEGGMGMDLVDDTLYVLPSVMEKGHVDIMYELHVQGGHSSIPFPHTGIGIIAEIIAALEAHPFKPQMIAGSPIHNHYVCRARYTPDAAPEITKLVKSGDLDTLAKTLASSDALTQFRLQTSQSVDMIAGGVKINAMPELITLGVNYRVAPQNSIEEVKKKTVQLIQPVVKKYGLTVKAFEGTNEEYMSAADSDTVRPLYDVDYNGTLVLSSVEETAVTPQSPTTGAVWDVFSGTIQHTFAIDNSTVVPVGELMTGNTDTRHYLRLTPNIYRWTPARKDSDRNIHTVDESIEMASHIEVAKFYYDLIRNFDASDA